MKILGRHLVIELSNCDKNKLNNLEYLEKSLDKSVMLSGAKKESDFQAILSESP